jgi:hypothetical protein
MMMYVVLIYVYTYIVSVLMMIRLRIDSEESLAGVWILSAACRWEPVDWS